MKIGIDIDGTITENFTLIKDLSCAYFGKPEEEIACWEWDFCKVFDITSEEAQEFWDVHEHRIYTIPGPKPLAAETIKKLSEEHEIYCITARNKNYHNETVNWLNQHGISYDKLYLTKDKQSICLKENIKVMIDDSPEYICLADHIPLIMFNYPYNRLAAHEKIIKVNTWPEVYDAILQINS